MPEEANAKPVGSQSPEPDTRLFALGFERLRTEQNLSAATVAGLAAAAAGAILWALITVATKYQIGFMAVGVGLLVGYAVRVAGKGMDKRFGVAGAALALLGCVVGNLLTVCYFVAVRQNVPFLDVLGRLTPDRALMLLGITFSAIDLIFYAIALYEGYRLSFREISQEQILRAAHGGPIG